MRLEFTPKKRGPANVVAEAELFFDANGPLHGMKLSGITIWTGERGLYCTFPSRQYEDKTGKRVFFDFLRSADIGDEGKQATYRLKDWILREWRKHNGDAPGDDGETPF